MSVVIHDDFWRAAQSMPKRQRPAFIYAVCAYAFDGTEPEGAPAWLPTFEAVRDRISMSARASERGRMMANTRWHGGDPKPSATDATTGAAAYAQAHAQAHAAGDAQAGAGTCTGMMQSKSKSKSKRKESVRETHAAKPSTERRRYGTFQNVLLSDAELARLRATFPDDWDQRVERLSSYMASKGKAYKNHLATIMNWARMDKAKAGGDEYAQYD
jgi:hypothetical protein